MKYAVIDWRGNGTADLFEKVFDTEEQAIKEAETQWAHMTKAEQEDSQFYVCSCELDEDGCINFDTAKVIKEW